MSLLRSRKFLTLILDTVIALVTYFVTKYVAPDMSKDVLFVLAGLQPIVLAVIVMWGVEDAAMKRAGILPQQRK